MAKEDNFDDLDFSGLDDNFDDIDFSEPEDIFSLKDTPKEGDPTKKESASRGAAQGSL